MESWQETSSEFEKRLMESFVALRQGGVPPGTLWPADSGPVLHKNYSDVVYAGKLGHCPVYKFRTREDSYANAVDFSGWQPVFLSEYLGRQANPLLNERFTIVPGEKKVPVAVSIEVKHTSNFLQSLGIRDDSVLDEKGKKKTGSGLTFSQLSELAATHYDNGIAGIVWSNAGLDGWLGGEAIAHAWWNFQKSKEQIALGQKPPRGVRSISWALFTQVKGQDPWSWYEEGFYPKKDKKK